MTPEDKIEQHGKEYRVSWRVIFNGEYYKCLQCGAVGNWGERIMLGKCCGDTTIEER